MAAQALVPSGDCASPRIGPPWCSRSVPRRAIARGGKASPSRSTTGVAEASGDFATGRSTGGSCAGAIVTATLTPTKTASARPSATGPRPAERTSSAASGDSASETAARAARGRQGGEGGQHARSGEAPASEPSRQLSPTFVESAFQRANRTAEPTGGDLMGRPVPVSEQERNAHGLGQAGQFVGDDGADFAEGELGKRIGFGRWRGGRRVAFVPGGGRPGLERQSSGGLEQPAGDGLAADQTTGLLREQRERRLGDVLGLGRRDLASRGPDQRRVPAYQFGERPVVPGSRERRQQVAVAGGRRPDREQRLPNVREASHVETPGTSLPDLPGQRARGSRNLEFLALAARNRPARARQSTLTRPARLRTFPP